MKNFKYIMLLIIFVQINLHSQFKINDIYEFSGEFLYSSDENLISDGDVIYREQYFLQYSNCKKINKKNIYILDFLFTGIETLSNRIELNRINPNNEFLVKNIKYYNHFKNHNGKKIEIKNSHYKIFKLSFKSIYLGDLNQYFKLRGQFKIIKIPTFFIYEFNFIEQ